MFINMKTKFLLVLIIILTVSVKAQRNIADNGQFCDQYSKIINFFKNDSCAKKEFPIKKFKIQIDSTVGYGIGFPIMAMFYISEQLQVNLINFNDKDSISKSMWEKLGNEEYENRNVKVTSICLKFANCKEKNKNINLGFARKNEFVVFVNASRIYNYARHTNGIFYLFFFDEKNNIKHVYQKNWIE